MVTYLFVGNKVRALRDLGSHFEKAGEGTCEMSAVYGMGLF